MIEGTNHFYSTLRGALTPIEIPNPSKEGPKVMIGCVVIGVFTGSIFLIVLLFVAGDINQVINSTAGPLLQILRNGTSNNAGAVCLLM